MLPIPALPDPGRPAVSALNALLRREEWARARLARHAGKTVRLAVGALKFSLTIDSEGHVDLADPAVVPDVTLTADPARFSVARLFQAHAASPAGRAEAATGTFRVGATPAGADDAAAAARARADAVADMMHISGDAGLAQVVAELAAHLRWDVEDDLARWFGDIPAARLVGGARALSAGLRGAATRLRDNVMEYLAQEQPVLTPRPLLQAWSGDVARASAALDAIQARLAALQARLRNIDDRRVTPARDADVLDSRDAALPGKGGA
ncbi:Ubiquinone biosynthesis accessory factor UbiJ [Bordetella sputigena]|uniref:ubiquinone biosynthesis accessory factor UbiJ n=1 Tax=Bordetella sputigena TaxID=1416810 RepID=UPI0039EECBFD